jgi:predicted restriction endonuclease
MYGAALKKFAVYLAKRQKQSWASEGPYAHQLQSIEKSDDDNAFTPVGLKDARERVLREVVRRRGQPQFRAKLIKAYGEQCAITGCRTLAILEAAHITPYLGPATNKTSNGILLRADIHTLWDLGLIAIDPEKNSVWINPAVPDDDYQRCCIPADKYE